MAAPGMPRDDDRVAPSERSPLLRARRWQHAVALVALASAACGGAIELAFTGTSRAPGLDGKVRVEPLEGSTSWVTYDVKNLPPAPRFGSGMTTFVVWVQGADPAAVKAGVLDYDREARQGFLHFTTPFDRFVVRLTAEQSRSVGAPSGPVLAEQRISVE